MYEMYPAQMALSAYEIEAIFGSLLDLSPFLIDRTYVSELSGGLTNRNIYVEAATGKYVARISSNESDYLAIDRESEFENSKIAAGCGIGAPVFDFLPGKGLLVIGFLPGRTFSAVEVNQNLNRVAQSCQKLHSANPFVREFNMFKIQRNYLQIVVEKGFRIPSDYQELTNQIGKLEEVLKQNAQPLVPCNNDLLPGNFIDDGEKIWLIDYEYSGNNDRCFELGNIWSEAMLPLDSLKELVHYYFQADRPEQFARAWLYAVFAKYSWTLWASIQESISAIDFDFWSWGLQKYEDSRLLFASPLYKEMIEQATKKQ
jgi:thiamine kinase-like enzyme